VFEILDETSTMNFEQFRSILLQKYIVMDRNEKSIFLNAHIEHLRKQEEIPSFKPYISENSAKLALKKKLREQEKLKSEME